MAAVGLHVGMLQRILLVQPRAAKLAAIFYAFAVDSQIRRRDLRLRQAKTIVSGWDHPTQYFGVVERILNYIFAILANQRQFTRPLLPYGQRMVDHVLLRHADAVF